MYGLQVAPFKNKLDPSEIPEIIIIIIIWELIETDNKKFRQVRLLEYIHVQKVTGCFTFFFFLALIWKTTATTDNR